MRPGQPLDPIHVISQSAYCGLRSRYRAMTFLRTLAAAIDSLNDTVGRAVSWLALLMVVVQFIVVVMRYVFGLGSIMMQESVVYMYGTMFMLGAGYTLLNDGHVRIDIFYREAAAGRRALVNLLGVVIFLWPVCLLIWVMSFPYVTTSWKVYEGSRETSGIQAVFLLKTVILIFTVLIALQGLSLVARSLLTLGGDEDPQRQGQNGGA